jgi:hypothetical protein
MGSRPLVLLVVALVVLSFLSVLSSSPVAAVCGDINERVEGAIQKFAPLTIEVDFAFTKTRSGDEIPYGFSKGATVTYGTTFMRFQANENDTYKVWFQFFYDSPIQQNVTLIIQEGSRSPERRNICMNGQSGYFFWQAIQVAPEPRIPTIAENWKFGEGIINNALSGLNEAAVSISSSVFWDQMENVVTWILLLLVAWTVRGVRKAMRGTG